MSEQRFPSGIRSPAKLKEALGEASEMRGDYLANSAVLSESHLVYPKEFREAEKADQLWAARFDVLVESAKAQLSLLESSDVILIRRDAEGNWPSTFVELRSLVEDINQIENGPGPIRANDIEPLKRVSAALRTVTDALVESLKGDG